MYRQLRRQVNNYFILIIITDYHRFNILIDKY